MALGQMRNMAMAATPSPIPAPQQPQFAPDFAFQKGLMQAETADREQQKIDLVGQKMIYDRQDKTQDLERKGYDAILANPNNAKMIAQQYHIPFTPQLETMLKNPQQMKTTLDGASLIKNMGIKNPEAINAFMGAYLQSGGDYSQAGQAIEGMETGAPMTEYQQSMLGVANQRLGLSQKKEARMAAGGGGAGAKPKYITSGAFAGNTIGADGIMRPTVGADPRAAATRGGSRMALHPSLDKAKQYEAMMLYHAVDKGEASPAQLRKLVGLETEANATLGAQPTAPAPVASAASIFSADGKGNSTLNLDAMSGAKAAAGGAPPSFFKLDENGKQVLDLDAIK